MNRDEIKKKVIIFDMDGVLFDSTRVANDYFMRAYPTLTQERMDEILCGNFHEELEKFKVGNPHIEETLEEKKLRKDAYIVRKGKSPLYDGVRELLVALHDRGYTLVINTSAHDANCLPLLANSNVTQFFDFIATAEVTKSKTEKFKIIGEKYGVEPSDMLFVTDTLGDVREADIAHVPTVGVTWGAHGHSHFKREPHENLVAVIDSVEELQSFILNR